MRPHTPLLVSLAARTIVVPGPAAGAPAGSCAVTGTILGSLPGAGAVFGSVAFALALSGAATVALPGTLAPPLSPAFSLSTASTAAGQKDIHAVIPEVSGHLVCGLSLVTKPAIGVIMAGICAEGCSPGNHDHPQPHADCFQIY